MGFAINAIYTIVLRNILLFKQFWKSSMIPDICDNALWFGAFAIGVGSLLSVGQDEYIRFIVPGAILLTGLYVSANETTFVLLSKVKAGGVWHGALATPVTLRHLMFGEILWASMRGTLSSIAMYIIALGFGLLNDPVFALWIFPWAFLTYFSFSAVGMLVTSFIKHEQLFSYFWVFWLSPSLLFSGVYFKLEELPAWAEVVAKAVPMTHSISIAQDIVLHSSISTEKLLTALALLGALTVLCFFVSHYKFKKRLYD